MKLSIVKQLIAENAYKVTEEPVLLSSGEESTEYIDAQLLFSKSDMFSFVASALSDYVPKDVNAIGGMETGAIPLATALGLKTYTNWFFLRKEVKNYGMENWFEGNVKPASKVLIVEDVVTTGRSVVEAVKTCDQRGLVPTAVLSLVIRDKNAIDFISRETGITDIRYVTDLEDLRNEHKILTEKQEQQRSDSEVEK